MFKFLKKSNLGANFSQKVEGLLGLVVQEELECIKKFAERLSWFLLELQLDLNLKEAKLKLQENSHTEYELLWVRNFGQDI